MQLLFRPRTEAGLADTADNLVRTGSRRRRHALRLSHQLLLLAALVFVPLLVLNFVYAWGERHHLLSEAGYRAKALAEMAAQQNADALRDDQLLLATLARMPEIASADTASCPAFLERVIQINPQLAELAVVRADGETVCASPGSHFDGLGNQPWVQAALRRDGGSSGDPAWSGLAELIRTGANAGDALAARVDLSLTWLMVARAVEADRMEIMLLDQPRRLVMAASEPELVGRSFPENPLFTMDLRNPGRVTGLDGADEIVAAAPMPGARQQILLVGVAVERLLTDMRRRSLITLVGVLLVAACVFAVACFMARWSFLRPLGALVAAAKRLRAGDLKVRVNSRELWAPEFSELAVALNIAAMRLERSHRALSDRANRDGLTGLASRRVFDDHLMLEWRRARRAQTDLSVLMIDVDEFKSYNDHYGHPMGDQVLRRIAGAMLPCLRRPSDLAARYGGEEIVILLPETDLAGAGFVASRLLTAVHELRIAHRGRPDKLLSVSIGVASAIPGDDEDPTASLVQAADEALYAAKRQGRGRAVLAGEVAPAKQPVS